MPGAIPLEKNLDQSSEHQVAAKVVRKNFSPSGSKMVRSNTMDTTDERKLAEALDKLKNAGFQIDSNNPLDIIEMLSNELQKVTQERDEIRKDHQKLKLRHSKIQGILTTSKKELNRIKVEHDKLKQQYNDLEKENNIDFKTGILNFKGIHSNLLSEIKRISRNKYIPMDKKKLYVAILDLDNFKKLNSDYGHIAADMVLQKVAQTIKNTVRESDIVGRFGGEEFVVIFTGPTDVAVSTEKVRAAVDTIFNCVCDGAEMSIPTSASVGVSTLEIPNKVNEDIISSIIENAFVRADNNLRKAKDAGKNRVILEE